MATHEGGARLGVEHEYRLWSGEQQIDFRALLPEVASGLRTLDPGDPRARRLPSGVSLTADGLEAELATPPVPIGAGAPARIDSLLATERSALMAEAAPHGVDRITGFSTHANLTVPDTHVVDVGARFVRHCGLATAFLTEPRGSLGLFVRPRRGRLEIGGEYAEGADLEALATWVAATVAALDGPAPPPELPAPAVEPSREKFGWFLAPGDDWQQVLAHARAARLGRRTAADHVAACWDWARGAGIRIGLDPAPVDRLVADGPWRVERDEPAETCTLGAVGDSVADAAPDTSAEVRPGGVTAFTRWLTWDHVVWELAREDDSLSAVLGVGQEPEFLARLRAGTYDELVAKELTRRRGRRDLVVHAQITGPAWWHRVRPGALVPAERTPDGRVPAVSYRRARRAWLAVRP